MKFLIAFVAIVAVTSADYLKPVVNANENIEAIIAAINHPSTDPATAVLLEQQLLQILGIPMPEPEPIQVGPAIIDEWSPVPIAIGPEIIDFPVPDGGVVTAVEPITVVDPMPVLDTPAQAAPVQSPLVQIILNVNAGNPGAVAVSPIPVANPEIPRPTPVAEIPQITPVHVVDVAVDNNPSGLVPEPVIVVETPSEPVVVVDTPPEPVIVAEPTFPEVPEAVIIPEPILIGEPIVIPVPAVVLPEILN